MKDAEAGTDSMILGDFSFQYSLDVFVRFSRVDGEGLPQPYGVSQLANEHSSLHLSR